MIYRISNGSYNKPKICSKEACLNNFLKHFPKENIVFMADRFVDPWFNQLVIDKQLKVEYINAGSSAQSFRMAIDYSLTNFPDNEIVYFVEDDYLHRENSKKILEEGIERAHYVTLYLCPDKAPIPGQHGPINPIVYKDDRGGEFTVVIRTPSSYFMMTNSTTLTFCVNNKTLREDYNIWQQYCFATPDQTHPHDFEAFLELRRQNRSLIMPIPTYSSHIEPEWLSRDVDWLKEI